MKDKAFKLKLLALMLLRAFECWRQETWGADLDEPYCCGGRDCGCGALTRREIYNSGNWPF